ncbi:hypothetical protein BKA93DRAFT_151345 [Sparassis latifolia]
MHPLSRRRLVYSLGPLLSTLSRLSLRISRPLAFSCRSNVRAMRSPSLSSHLRITRPTRNEMEGDLAAITLDGMTIAHHLSPALRVQTTSGPPSPVLSCQRDLWYNGAAA